MTVRTYVENAVLLCMSSRWDRLRFSKKESRPGPTRTDGDLSTRGTINWDALAFWPHKKLPHRETKAIPTGCENTSIIFLIEHYSSRTPRKNRALSAAFILTVATNSVQTARPCLCDSARKVLAERHRGEGQRPLSRESLTSAMGNS